MKASSLFFGTHSVTSQTISHGLKLVSSLTTFSPQKWCSHGPYKNTSVTADPTIVGHNIKQIITTFDLKRIMAHVPVRVERARPNNDTFQLSHAH